MATLLRDIFAKPVDRAIDGVARQLGRAVHAAGVADRVMEFAPRDEAGGGTCHTRGRLQRTASARTPRPAFRR